MSQNRDLEIRVPNFVLVLLEEFLESMNKLGMNLIDLEKSENEIIIF